MKGLFDNGGIPSELTLHLHLGPTGSVQGLSDACGFDAAPRSLQRYLAVCSGKMGTQPRKRKTWFSGNRVLIWAVMKENPDSCKEPRVTSLGGRN